MKFNGIIEQQAADYRAVLARAKPGSAQHRDALTITLLAYLCAKSDENGAAIEAIGNNPLLDFGRRNKVLLSTISLTGAAGTIVGLLAAFTPAI